MATAEAESSRDDPGQDVETKDDQTKDEPAKQVNQSLVTVWWPSAPTC